MKDSVTYQAIVEEGEIKASQEVLLKLGGKRFGAASETITLAIRSITDLDRLEALIDRLLDASSWQQLLGPG